MSAPWELAVHGWGWAHLLLGLGALGVLGAGLADRILPGERLRWVLAPVLALSALTLVQVLAHTTLGVPVTPAGTVVWWGLLTLWAWAPRLGDLRPPSLRRPGASSVRTALGLVAVFGFVALAHGLPHLPGPAPDGLLDAYPTLAERLQAGLAGDGFPYPIHVDEHIHIAQTQQLARSASLDLQDPYTGEPRDTGLFTVSGLRSERGFELMTLQVTHLTGLGIAALYRFAPALWAGYIAVLLWATLRPAPGALAGAALVAASPTTARLLGLGLLVPSAFAVAWVPAVVWVTLRGRGGGRFGGLLLLITGAFFMHTVLGVVAILAGLSAIATTGGTWRRKLGIAVAVLLPLVWILPVLWRDAVAAVAGETRLSFDLPALQGVGPLLPAAAAGGLAAAWIAGGRPARPHRAFSILGLGLATSMLVSVLVDHRSDATYTRIAFTAYLCLAAVAGHGLAVASRRILGWLRQAETAPALCAVLVALVLVWPVAANLSTPLYRVWDEEAWDQHDELAAMAGPGDVFLAHPWRAPLYSAFTGAQPHAVLYPGAPPVRGADWSAHVEGPQPERWYEERGIRFVIGGPRPDNTTASANHIYLLATPRGGF